MMFRRGVFVPPICPTSPLGCIPDLRAAPFSFRTGSCTSNRQGLCTETEAYVSFGESDSRGEYQNLVESDSLVLPIDSALAVKIRQIAEASKEASSVIRDSTYSPRIAKMKKAFCDRIANCRGIINGECWALGPVAVREIIERA